MTHISEFLERNKNKSFVTNLKKYNTLSLYGKMKCITSFLTHIFIDAEQNIDNTNIQEDLLSILTSIVLYKQDTFLDWLEQKIKIN